MEMVDDGVVAASKRFPGGWSAVAKPCDYCKSAAALLFCRAELSFMCAACDAKVHAATNKLASRHERVWMCEVCEQAPASVTCKADAAALCVTCDCDIHSANPLAQRHERIPVVPFYDTVECVVKSPASTLLAPSTQMVNPTTIQALDTKIGSCPGSGNFSTDSWISSNPIKSSKYTTENPDLKSSMELLLSDSDQFLDFDYPVSKDNYYNPGSDSVVPVQTMKPPSMPARLVVDHHSSVTRFEIDFTRSSINSYNNNNSYTALSLNHVSSSSLDIGIVPDGSSISETSYSFGGSSVDVSATVNGNQAIPMVGKDREARVLRYREKRKNRKFEKTIRYASRKAYAETRPRVKGRFAKRSSSDVECEIDQMFINSGFDFSEARFGVVPSFG